MTFSLSLRHFYTGTKVRKFQEWAESWAGFAPAFFMGRGIFQYRYVEILFGILD